MAVYTDSPACAAMLLEAAPAETFTPAADPSPMTAPLLAAVLAGTAGLYESSAATGWPLVLVRDLAPASQYDLLIDCIRLGQNVPDRAVCIAAEGTGFHGFRGRGWAALRGNVHVAVHFAPACEVARFDTVFTALAAVSLVEAIGAVLGDGGGRAGIKWVNDILVDGAKVGGVLAWTQSRSRTVDAVVLGMGLNVEATPVVERSAYVPAVGSLRDFVDDPTAVRVAVAVGELLARLDQNYRLLLEQGYPPIMQRYRSYSAVIGEEVTICSEPGPAPVRIIATGRVCEVGDSLELHLAERAEPVRHGRLLLGSVAAEAIT